jgi:hypothetical protein
VTKTLEELALEARQAHHPAMTALLDYVDAVRDQVAASAMADGAAAALERLSTEVDRSTGWFSEIDSFDLERLLEKRAAMYENTLLDSRITTGALASHAARLRGAAQALRFLLKELRENSIGETYGELDPKKFVRRIDERANHYRTGEKKV